MNGTENANRRDGSEPRSSTRKRPPIPLSADLERTVLAEMLRGTAPLDCVGDGELSKSGRIIRQALVRLKNGNGGPPYEARTVYLSATEVLGGDREEVRGLLETSLALPTTTTGTSILVQLAERRLLLDVMNTAAAQLSAGTLDLGPIDTLLSEYSAPGVLKSMSQLFEHGLPPEPVGVPLKSLPALTHKIGGVHGIWAIAGEPKVGKSTLGWQIALDVGQSIPVVFYDFENGFATIAHRLKEVFGNDVDRLRRGTERIYYRDSIRSLDSDLSHVAPPALVVVDSLQKLPATVEFHREGLVKWVHRLEALKKRGYSVLEISEISRANYGDVRPFIGIFKETGEIEYSADVGAQMTRFSDNETHFHIVAHRHRNVSGRVAVLQRYRSWFFKEA